MQLLAFLGLFAISQAAQSECACSEWTQPKLNISTVMGTWSQVWKGNFGLLNQTVTPDVAIWQDRIPIPGPSMLNGSASNPHVAEYVNVRNQAQLVDFIKTSHKGFSEYGFINQFYFVNSEGSKLATRWTLNATVGNDTTSTTLKSGDLVSMNGTDIVMFDECSGRIQQVLTAQDMLAYSHDMGIDVDLPGSEGL